MAKSHYLNLGVVLFMWHYFMKSAKATNKDSQDPITPAPGLLVVTFASIPMNLVQWSASSGSKLFGSNV